ncbi:MAG: SUMF1/EgtB/PvdO family nonheme iron enzyme [Myxococcota bacterium]
MAALSSENARLCARCNTEHGSDEGACPQYWIGKTLKQRYELTELIGTGGMGRVYGGRDKETGREIAVKMLMLSQETPGKLLRRARLERQILARLAAIPGVVQILDQGELSSECPYVVMERLRGRPLSQIFDHEPRQLSRVVGFVLRASEIVASAHAEGILHRDLKPDNLFVVQHGMQESLMVLDFGISKVLTHPSAQESTEPLTLTRLGEFMGTLPYASPEQVLDMGGVDARTDIYALGAILFRLLTSRSVLYDCPPDERALCVVQGRISRSPRRLRSDVPEWLDELVSQCLATDKSQRPASMLELAHRLREGMLKAPTHTAREETVNAPLDVLTNTRSQTGPTLLPLVTTRSLHLEPETSAGAARVQGEVSKEEALSAQPAQSEPTETVAARAPMRAAEPKKVTSLRWVGATLAILVTFGLFLWYFLGRDSPTAAPSSTPTTAPVARHPPGTVLFEGGVFTQGSSAEQIKATMRWCHTLTSDWRAELYAREQPQRNVKLSAFWFDQREVTLTQYITWVQSLPVVAFEGDTLRAQDGLPLLSLLPGGPVEVRAGKLQFDAEKAHHPISGIRWEAAQRYCQTLGGQLPTEAQWEFAARGSLDRAFPWGATKPSCMTSQLARGENSSCSQGDFGPVPVGSFSQDRTPEGVLDLAGNVSEWVLDGFQERYASCTGVCLDPVQPPGQQRVARGGNFALPLESARGAGRMRQPAEAAPVNVGFRCAGPVLD